MLGWFKKDKPAEQDSPAASAPASFLKRLKDGLKHTSSRLSGLLSGRRIDEALFEELEATLIGADTGLEATEHLLAQLRADARKANLETGVQLKQALAVRLLDLLSPLEPATAEPTDQPPKPLVIMLAGVNGAGKTTSIGQLAKHFQGEGLSVLLAAGDTFRAAAREQLAAWGTRNNVDVIGHAAAGGNADPAAVIYDAVQAAKARGIDVVLADTAGRLPTQLHLMEEVKKIKRVIAKADASAPHEVWLVLDANNGQNALAQLRAFDTAIGVTGIILTKLDGTAKGGVIAAISRYGTQRSSARPLKLVYIGVGEGLDDLRVFNARDFVTALLD